MNAVVLAVGVMLALSLCRVHVVVALIVGAVAGGLAGGLTLDDTLQAFQAGLGKGATVALSYALLGAFAVAIAKSGTAHALADRALGMINGGSKAGAGKLRLILLALLLGAAIASQNILPIHIAFIPLLIPPLLFVMNKLRLDRRLVACVLTFGLITPYMFLPVGFGAIFLNDILLANMRDGGLDTTGINVMQAMALPALGMAFGLAVAFVSYRRKRDYAPAQIGGRRQASGQGRLQSQDPAGGTGGGGSSLCRAALAGLDDHGCAGRLHRVFHVRCGALARGR